jgi:NDP-sugar pyrophosphorylase family protein
LIQAYFKEGQDWNLRISYSYETVPLGTAGPIARMPRRAESMLVLNGDLLTTLDFASIVRFHYENAAAATIGSKRRTEKVDFGVIESAPGGLITDFREKPSLEYLVSMGIYVFSPEVREFIPRGERFDFPELLQRLLANGRRVLSYETDAYWMDIGRPGDYEQANADFPAMENAFLGSPYVARAAV